MTDWNRLETDLAAAAVSKGLSVESADDIAACAAQNAYDVSEAEQRETAFATLDMYINGELDWPATRARS